MFIPVEFHNGIIIQYNNYTNISYYMENIETKETLKYSPMVKPKLVNIFEIAPDITMSFTEEQYIKLQKGITPKAMEDKWFVFFKDGWLHFLRSWTGEEMYRAEIIKEEDGGKGGKYSITEFYVESDEKLYKDGDNKIDLDIIFQIIFWGLLGIDTRERFIEKYGTGETGSILIWSIFGRMFFPDT